MDGAWKIDLSENKLSGTLPPEWASPLVANIDASLELNDNNLTGTIPASWAGKMRTINFANNQLSGAWPAGLVPTEECLTAGNGRFTNCPTICCEAEMTSCDCGGDGGDSSGNSASPSNAAALDEESEMDGFVRKGVKPAYGAIIGGIVGGLCLLCIVGGFLYVMTRSSPESPPARATTTGASSSRSFTSAGSTPQSEYGIVHAR